MSAPEAGWYTNPSGPGVRYWDGHGWTEHVDQMAPVAPYQSPSVAAPPPRPFTPPPPPPPYAGYAQPPGPPAYSNPGYAPAQGTSGLVVVGYVMAAVIPLVGFILGIVIATRPDPNTSKHGVWVIVVSVVAAIVWYAIWSSGSSSSSYTY